MFPVSIYKFCLCANGTERGGGGAGEREELMTVYHKDTRAKLRTFLVHVYHKKFIVKIE